MNVFLLYLILLKGTMTAFAGLASLPVIQDVLVFHDHVLADKQLNEAVVITRSTPGPVGLYIVSVGYFVAGVPGAIVGRDDHTRPVDYPACAFCWAQNAAPPRQGCAANGCARKCWPVTCGSYSFGARCLD
jgi:Chromate transporter